MKNSIQILPLLANFGIGGGGGAEFGRLICGCLGGSGLLANEVSWVGGWCGSF